MNKDNTNKTILKIILLAALLSGFTYLLQSDIGINISDEGYLLYGAMETAAGKVVKLDFRGYDPGRYYWLAAWSLIFGDGLLAMRFYLAVFGGIGVCFGLLAARRVVKSFWALIPVGILLQVWMFPRFHPFELAFAMATVFFTTRLIEAPTLRRYFYTGIFVGLAAFFGRNLGVYGVLAVSAAALYIHLRVERGLLIRGYTLFIGGIFIGFSPIFIMSVFIPGFFSSFVDTILFSFRVKTTNLPLPVPWPWLAFNSGAKGLVFYHYFFVGVLFLIMPLFYLLCLVRLPFIKKEDIKRNALLTGSLFTGVFYMQYVFSRADIFHFARGVHPLLLAMIALAFLIKGNIAKKALLAITAVFLAVSTYYSVIPMQPAGSKYIFERGNYTKHLVRGKELWLSPAQYGPLNLLTQTVAKWVPADEGLFMAPYLPTMYYILKRDAPTHNTYFLFKATPEEQQKIINSLENHNVRWAIIGDIPLDGHDELRFSNTHDIVWQYLQRNYVVVDPLWRLPAYVFLRKRDTGTKNTE